MPGSTVSEPVIGHRLKELAPFLSITLRGRRSLNRLHVLLPDEHGSRTDHRVMLYAEEVRQGRFPAAEHTCSR
jgi:hypothetical protein